jgi:hypothetical protein
MPLAHAVILKGEQFKGTQQLDMQAEEQAKATALAAYMPAAPNPVDPSKKFQYNGNDVGPAYAQLQKTASASNARGLDKIAHSIDTLALSAVAAADAEW